MARAADRAEPSPADPATAPTHSLDDLINGTWATLLGGEAATCPVCSAGMTPRWSAGAGVVGGRCGDCGTTLR